MQEVLLSTEFWKFALPLLGAVVAWFINEWRKRLADQYQRKEANYKELLRAFHGFYEGAESANELKQEFLKQLSVSLLYCPDDVIRKGYAFLETVHAREMRSNADKERAFGAFVLAIRQDLLSRKLVDST
jgi:hypothetical protein